MNNSGIPRLHDPQADSGLASGLESAFFYGASLLYSFPIISLWPQIDVLYIYLFPHVSKIAVKLASRFKLVTKIIIIIGINKLKIG